MVDYGLSTRYPHFTLSTRRMATHGILAHLNLRAQNTGVVATLLLLLVLSGGDSRGTSPDSVKKGPVIEARFVLGPDHCPKAVQIWLVSTPDTIQGLEVFLTWDRPDFALFETRKPKVTPLSDRKRAAGNKDSLASVGDLPLQPVIDRSGGLLKPWEFVEGRGENGLWAKVTALAYLMSQTKPRPISPGESGALFSIPLVPIKSQMPFADGDSAVVRMDGLLTRISDNKGKLLEHLILRDAVVRVAPCKKTSKQLH
jgi:hypothetical protein